MSKQLYIVATILRKQNTTGFSQKQIVSHGVYVNQNEAIGDIVTRVLSQYDTYDINSFLVSVFSIDDVNKFTALMTEPPTTATKECNE